jgi:siroheme synthase (precorrin-2 oxidase/ferrochelatase)
MASEPKAIKAETGEIKARRQTQLGELDKAIDALSQKIRDQNEKERRARILQSVSLGLYEEVDKLAKKAPADEVTELVLEQTNDVIREGKELLSDDTFIERLKEFVPAGNNPQHRDVVVILRQLRQGLERFWPNSDKRKEWLERVLEDAKGVRLAVLLSLEGRKRLTKNDIAERGWKIMSDWLSADYIFDFDRLDRVNIQNYYNI